MPITDWQFWVVTALALAALAWLIRTFYRIFNPQKSKPASTKTTLTIHGQKQQQKPKHNKNSN